MPGPFCLAQGGCAAPQGLPRSSDIAQILSQAPWSLQPPPGNALHAVQLPALTAAVSPQPARLQRPQETTDFCSTLPSCLQPGKATSPSLDHPLPQELCSQETETSVITNVHQTHKQHTLIYVKRYMSSIFFWCYF